MSNTIDITRPSYLGIPSCINETVSISNDLAQCVGTDARWPSAVRRYMTCKVTGEAYLTESNRDTLREGATVTFKSSAAWMIGIVTRAERITKVRGRAVVGYGVVINKLLLPYAEDLFALYVPKWQEPNIAAEQLTDYSGNNYHLLHTSGSSPTVSGSGAVIGYDTQLRCTLSSPDTLSDYTILADRDIDTTGGNYTTGIKLRNGTSTTTYLETRRPNTYATGSLGREVNFAQIMPDGWSVQSNEARSSVYNDIAEWRAGTTTRVTKIVWGVGESSAQRGRLWRRCRAIAIWRRRLDDAEIRAAQTYLNNTPTADDMH